MAEEEGSCAMSKLASDWVRMSQVVEYADSHLSQRGERRIHASCKSAERPGTEQTVGPCIGMPPLECESQESPVDGGLPGYESMHLSDPAT